MRIAKFSGTFPLLFSKELTLNCSVCGSSGAHQECHTHFECEENVTEFCVVVFRLWLKWC